MREKSLDVCNLTAQKMGRQHLVFSVCNGKSTLKASIAQLIGVISVG